MKTKNKSFKLFAKFPQKDKTTEYQIQENGSLTIEGVASTTNKDLADDIILPSAIEQMKKQATQINLLSLK